MLDGAQRERASADESEGARVCFEAVDERVLCVRAIVAGAGCVFC